MAGQLRLQQKGGKGLRLGLAASQQVAGAGQPKYAHPSSSPHLPGLGTKVHPARPSNVTSCPPLLAGCHLLSHHHVWQAAGKRAACLR